MFGHQKVSVGFVGVELAHEFCDLGVAQMLQDLPDKGDVPSGQIIFCNVEAPERQGRGLMPRAVHVEHRVRDITGDIAVAHIHKVLADIEIATPQIHRDPDVGRGHKARDLGDIRRDDRLIVRARP